MSKILKVPLSTKNLKELTKKMNTLKKDVEKTKNEIVKDLLETAEREIISGYAISPYEGYQEDFTFGKEKNKAFVRGNQVIYREFGTGTEGSNNAHPIKGEFNLNEYNSGSKIRPASIVMKPETGILLRRTILDI